MSPKSSRNGSISRPTSAHPKARSDGDRGHDQAAAPPTAGIESNAPTKRKRVNPEQYNFRTFHIAMKPGDWVKRRIDPVPLDASPRSIAALLSLYLQDADREHLVVVPVNRRSKAMSITTVTMGDLSQTTVEAREVYKPAILLNAVSLIVAKNRISGSIEPTPHDFQQVKEWREVGWLLGCMLTDYLILGYGGRYFSFYEEGQLPKVPLQEHFFGK